MSGLVRTDRVAIQQLELLDAARIRFRKSDPKLIASIQKSGVLQPLIAAETGKLVVLDGYRRCAVLSDSEQVPVKVFKDVSDAITVSVLLNMSVLPYTEMERTAVVGIWDEMVGSDDDRIRTVILPMMGLKPTMEILDRCRRTRLLHPVLKTLLMSKSAPLQFADRISRESGCDQQQLAEFFVEQHLSMSRIMTAYDWLFYIRKQTGRDVTDILDNLPSSDAVQKLEQMRYPRTSAFREKCKLLSSDYANSLTFPPDFSGGSPTYSFKAGRVQDVRRALSDMEKMLTDEDLFKLVAELRGED